MTKETDTRPEKPFTGKSLEQVIESKKELKRLLQKYPFFLGIGIGVSEDAGGRFQVLRVYLKEKPSFPLPTEFEGIPVEYEITGDIVAY